MCPKQTNRLPVRIANDHGSAERILASIARETPSLASWITPASVTSRDPAWEEIEEDSDRRNRNIDHDEDPLSDKESGHHDDTPEPNESAYDNDEPTAPSRNNLEELVERQQKMIEFLFQHNTKRLERRRSSTSDAKDKFKMAHLEHYCGRAGELETYLRSLQSNFRTHKHLFHQDKDKVHYSPNHLGSWAYHTNRVMQGRLGSTQLPGAKTYRRTTRPTSTIITFLMREYRRCKGTRTGDSTWLENHSTTSRKATTTRNRTYEHTPIDYGGIGENQSGVKCSSN